MTRVAALLSWALLLVVVPWSNPGWAWTWRDIKIGVTTDKIVLDKGGEPTEVRMGLDDYLELKAGRIPEYMRFYYRWAEGVDDHKEKQRIIEMGPLNSTFIFSYEVTVFFRNNRVINYHYQYSFGSAYASELVGDLKSLFGNPTRIRRESNLQVYYFKTVTVVITNNTNCGMFFTQ